MKALKKTLDSFKDVCNEVVYGDLLIFEEDRLLLKEYQKEYNLKIVPLVFNHIFKNGFAKTLNDIAFHATNDFVLYMNTSEVVDGEQRILRLMNEMFHEYNCFAFDHAQESHSWFRLYNRHEVWWDGVIHEELIGNRKDCPYYLFRMKDEEKDNDDTFKAKVYNDIKEICYFYQYLKLVDNPAIKGITNDWWVNFAKENYDSMKQRLFDKRERYEAFLEGDFGKFIKAINEPSFKDETHKSSTLVEFQGDQKTL